MASARAVPLTLDVLVVGAGPAGAATALALAPHCRVGLAGRAVPCGPRIGESLPAAARTLLADLGLWDAFKAQGHRPAWSRVSLWGGPDESCHDAVFDPHGPGWHLDRARFDALLRQQAVLRGAVGLYPSELRDMHRASVGANRWRCLLQTPDGPREVLCRLLVDATGRAARLVRQAGGDIVRMDRLVCLHAWLPPHPQGPAARPGTTLIEADADGWWYSADLPSGGSVLAWHTDSDLPEARACGNAQALIARALQTQLIRERCTGYQQPLADGPRYEGAGHGGLQLHIAPAHSQRARRAAGDDWLAVGDAALAFDPLASQGLMNGLYMGLAAAATATRHLAGDAHALPEWAGHAAHIAGVYRANLARYYALESRWQGSSFWRRRRPARSEHAEQHEDQDNAEGNAKKPGNDGHVNLQW
ncbi:MAG: NAD(P)/FAD-dependent oxidoreductase [Ramlibacter sp.]